MSSAARTEGRYPPASSNSRRTSFSRICRFRFETASVTDRWRTRSQSDGGDLSGRVRGAFRKHPRLEPPAPRQQRDTTKARPADTPTLEARTNSTNRQSLGPTARLNSTISFIESKAGFVTALSLRFSCNSTAFPRASNAFRSSPDCAYRSARP